MRTSHFVGRGCLTRKPDDSRRAVSALIHSVDAKIASDAALRERFADNRLAAIASAERYRRSLIEKGVLSPVGAVGFEA